MILVNGVNILSNNVTDNGTEWVGDDIIIPKSVAPSAVLVDVVLPNDFSVSEYEYVNGALQKKAPVLPLVEVPKSVAMWRARAVLEQHGYKPTIDAALVNDVVARNKWEYATEIMRDDSLIASMAVLLNLTDADIDNLFIEASKL